MRIYLLVLLLAVLAQSKFRHLRNLTLTVPGAPLIKCLSPSEIAYQFQDSLVVYDIDKLQELQNIKLPQTTPAQFLPSSQALIYSAGSDISQIRSNSKQTKANLTLKDSDWTPAIGAFGGDVVLAVYGEDSAKNVKIYGTGSTPWNNQTILWIGPKEDVHGGSGVSMLAQDEFYFAAGGSCKGSRGSIYLQQGSRAGIKNIFNFTVSDCNFGEINKEWTLQSYNFNQAKYHLLTYAPLADSPKRYTSQLISNAGGEYQEVVHFDVERLIGAVVVSEDVIYTADSLLCRVLQHDIQNHEHEHQTGSSFQYVPKSIFVAFSQKYFVTLTDDFDKYTRIVVNQFIGRNKFIAVEIDGPRGNAVRAELFGDNYLLISSDDANRLLTLYDRTVIGSAVEVLKGVVDFCVSSFENIYYVVLESDLGGQTLSVHTITAGQLVNISEAKQIPFNVKSISCLNKKNVLLIPEGDSNNITVYMYNSADETLSKRSQIVKDTKIHGSFAYVDDILIFTNSSSNSSIFYDHDFQKLAQSFNLPASSVYRIVQARKGQLLLAVGDDVDHFVSLQYYAIEGSVITYKGTFPYFDDGQAILSNMILLPDSGILHIEYGSNSGLFSTYFDLSKPPLISIGYFYDADTQCSEFSDAIFHVTRTAKELIVLNKNDKPTIEKYAITDKLTKTESVDLPFKPTYLSLKQSSNPNEIIISGINKNINYAIEIRNINMLSKVIFSKEKQFAINLQSLESTEVANELVVSVFTDENKDGSQALNIFFDANTNNAIAAQTDKFTSVNLLATCPKCNKIAFTGDLKTPIAGTTIVVQDYQNPSNADIFDIACKINFLALSPSGSKLAYNCLNNTIFAYASGISTPLPQTFTTITELAFLDEGILIANLDGKPTSISITANNPHVFSGRRNGAVSSYAVDYNKQIYAVAVGVSTIQIYNINNAGTPIETITINNIDQIASMSFNSNNQLFVVTVTGTVIALTQQPCNKDETLDGFFCICKSLFVQNLDQCTCNFVYDSAGGNCYCVEGSYFNGGSGCDSCSAMCSSCSQGGAFDCDDFSVWFYVIIIASILIIASGVLLTVFKLRKREKQDTMYTEEKTKMSDQFLSEKEQQSQQNRRKFKSKSDDE